MNRDSNRAHSQRRRSRLSLLGLLALLLLSGVTATACNELTAPRFPEPDVEQPDPNEGENEG